MKRYDKVPPRPSISCGQTLKIAIQTIGHQINRWFVDQLVYLPNLMNWSQRQNFVLIQMIPLKSPWTHKMRYTGIKSDDNEIIKRT